MKRSLKKSLVFVRAGGGAWFFSASGSLARVTPLFLAVLGFRTVEIFHVSPQRDGWLHRAKQIA